MSKIGKKNIIIPKDSSVKIEGPNVTITGPKGTKTLTINDKIFSSKLNESEFNIQPLEKKIDKKTSVMWGTYRSLISNAVTGVSTGHEKILSFIVNFFVPFGPVIVRSEPSIFIEDSFGIIIFFFPILDIKTPYKLFHHQRYFSELQHRSLHL